MISDAALVLGGAESKEDIDLLPIVAAMLGELLGFAVPAQRFVGRQLVQGTGPRRGCVADCLGVLDRSGGCHPVAGELADTVAGVVTHQRLELLGHGPVCASEPGR